MVFIVLVAPWKSHWLCTIVGLPSNTGYMWKMSTPLPALQSIFPALSNKHTLIPFWVIFGWDRTKMVRGNSDKYLPTCSIGLPTPLSPLSSICLVRPIPVVYKMIYLWRPSRTNWLGNLCHSNSYHKGRIDTGLTRHFGRNGAPALCTGTLPLPNPFLEAFKAEIVSTWCLAKAKNKNLINNQISQAKSYVAYKDDNEGRHNGENSMSKEQ